MNEKEYFETEKVQTVKKKLEELKEEEFLDGYILSVFKENKMANVLFGTPLDVLASVTYILWEIGDRLNMSPEGVSKLISKLVLARSELSTNNEEELFSDILKEL